MSFTEPTEVAGAFARGFFRGLSDIGGVIVLSLFVGVGLALGVLSVYAPYQAISLEAAKENQTVIAKTTDRLIAN